MEENPNNPLYINTGGTPTLVRGDKKIGRNEACPCGATKVIMNKECGRKEVVPIKFKRCCGKDKQ